MIFTKQYFEIKRIKLV